MTLLDRAADKMREMFPTLPYVIRFSYRGGSSTVGSGPERFALEFHDESGLQDLARGDLASLLDRYSR